jgi:hypothetical protein
MGSDLAYLVEDVDVTVRLLADPLLWRVRAVDELLVDAGASFRRRRSLHCLPLRDFLPVPPEATSAFIAIPLSSMPRGPLLDFDVEGPAGNAWLLPRSQIAKREAAYLAALVQSAGGHVTDLLTAFFESLVGFADGYRLDADGRQKAIPAFLEDGLGHPLSASATAEVERLSHVSWMMLRPRSDHPRTSTAPEISALGIPGMLNSGAAVHLDEAIDALRQYTSTVVEMSRRAQLEHSAEADVFLDVLADYGHNYELTVATKVPVDEPFTLKFQERRDLKLTRWRNRGQIPLLIADAQTNHVTFRVDDANVRVADCALRTANGTGKPAFGAFVPRQDSQTQSFYCYDDDRDYRAILDFRLSMLVRLMVVPYLVALLTAILAVALVAMDVSGVRDVALVATPATIAAGVLGVRESTTLGSRLRLLNSAVVALALALLVLAATWQLVGN